MRLRGEAGDGHAGGNARARHGTEIDVRGHVDQPGIAEWIGERAVAVMRHQGAAVALRVVILGRGKAVIDEQHRPACTALGDARHQGLGRRI